MHTPYFNKQLHATPDTTALADLSRTRSWQELDLNIARMAEFLAGEAGLRPNDHIAIMVGNRVEYIELMLAGMLAGLWVTPVNTHLNPQEVDYIRRDSGAKILFHDDAHQHLLLANADDTCKAMNVNDVAQQLPDTPSTPIDAHAPAGGTMLYTSGTTGKPKGVKRAKPNTVAEMVERMQNLGRAFGLTGNGPHLVTGPLYHAAPGLLAMYDMINGAPMVVLPKWSCDSFFNTVRDYRVTTTHLVPTMFIRLLEAWEQRQKSGSTDEIDLSSLQYVLHGAAPISQAVKQRMIDWWGPILTEYWGATESGVVTMVSSEDWLSHPGTVGRAIANFEVFVADELGNPTGEDEGLLFCRHKHLAQVFSYHNDPDKTRSTHPQDYVFSLGDIGRIDEDGFVYLSDRKSNMIISGGVNIYPTEVEQALLEHEDIADAAVFGLPDPEWGETVKAVVELREGLAPQPEMVEEIRSFLREHIAGFKIPRAIEFTDKLPRNPSGKVPIRELKARYS